MESASLLFNEVFNNITSFPHRDVTREKYFRLLGVQIPDKRNHLKNNQLSNRPRTSETRKETDLDQTRG